MLLKVIVFVLSIQTPLLFGVNKERLEKRKARKCTAASGPLKGKITPNKIHQWMVKNKVFDQGELLCCLPDEVKYPVSNLHYSRSFQLSHHSSPRLLFGMIQNGMIFTMVGSGEEAMGNDAIEFISSNSRYENLNSSEIIVSRGDASTKGSSQIKESPQSCLGCHGNEGMTLGPGGLRTIFNPHPWPILNQGEGEGGRGSVCKGFNRYQEAAEKAAMEAILSDPKFDCLSESKLRNRQPSSIYIDEDLQDKDAVRVTKDIMETKDYDKYKYILLAISADCFSEKDANHLPRLVSNISSWIPGHVLNEMNENLNISSELQSKFTFAQKSKAIDKSAEETVKKAANMNRMLLGTKDVLSRRDDIDVNLFYARCTPYKESPSSNLQSWFLEQPLNLQDYIQDTQLRRAKLKGGVYFNDKLIRIALVRFLFESRKINAMNWDMLLERGYYTRDIAHFNVLTQLDPDLVQYAGKENEKSICEDLRKKSMASFSEKKKRVLKQKVMKQGEVQ